MTAIAGSAAGRPARGPALSSYGSGGYRWRGTPGWDPAALGPMAPACIDCGAALARNRSRCSACQDARRVRKPRTPGQLAANSERMRRYRARRRAAAA